MPCTYGYFRAAGFCTAFSKCNKIKAPFLLTELGEHVQTALMLSPRDFLSVIDIITVYTNMITLQVFL